MSQIINTNVASLNAQRNLATSQGSLTTSIQRLSSGLRINSAKDDAAGLAITERMTSQIRGVDQARRNANDGISLAQTAEGALAQSSEILQRIRELAVQSANATNSAGDRKALNAEVNQLVTELNRIASDTSFNGLKILDGSYQAQQFQVGADANQTIGISLAGARTTDLRNNLTGLYSGTANSGLGEATAAASTPAAGNGVAAQILTVAGSSGTDTVSIGNNDKADVIATAINNKSGTTGVNARALSTAYLDQITSAGTVSFTLNGGGTATVVTAQITATTDFTEIATAINNVSAKTGVTARLDDAKTQIILEQKEGKDITIQDFTNTGGGTGRVYGQNFDATTDKRFESDTTGAVTLTSGGTDSTRIAGVVEIYSERGFTVTSDTGNTVNTTGTTASASVSINMTAADVSTIDLSNQTLKIVDASLAQLSRMRADLGAVQNRFMNTIANLQTTSENVSASRSRIRDADFAQETANLTRAQILQQAGVAMLAQANNIPQNVLSLLK